MYPILAHNARLSILHFNKGHFYRTQGLIVDTFCADSKIVSPTFISLDLSWLTGTDDFITTIAMQMMQGFS